MSHEDRQKAACLRLFQIALGSNWEDAGARATPFDVEELDWNRLAAYLAGSGLARPLLGVLNEPILRTLTPETFRQSLAERGIIDVVRERAQRDVIARLDAALTALGGRGVLLKGTALLMRAPLGAVSRATGDVDLFVDADLAVRLRAYLLDHGFEGTQDGRMSARHHLAPVSRGGIDVEIHTRIMEPVWGLPESEMLASVEALPASSNCVSLSTLSAEGLVLHSLVHLSASFYSFGLRTAWDATATLRHAPLFDWERLVRWGNSSALPAAFWAPLTTLADVVGVPRQVLGAAATDHAARRVEQLARARIFTATEGLFDLDAMSKAAFVMLLHDRWRDRLRYLRQVVGFRAARPDTWNETAGRAARSQMLAQFWVNYRRYRQLAR